MSIPANVVQLTGVTDADVNGRALDPARWEDFLGQCSMLVGHNACYDAVLVERLFPALRGASWACSMREIDWAAAGYDGRVLGYLLMQSGYFNNGHRASADVVSLAHLLAQRLQDWRPAMASLLENADRPTVRIDATRAGYEAKDLLKGRGYRWNPAKRVWWTEIDAADVEAETAWLAIDGQCTAPSLTQVTAAQRHR